MVVPVYNSSESLLSLADRLERVLQGLEVPYEMILVNDCSRDNSWETIRRLVDSREWVRGINLMKNYGQHNALLCGIRNARYATTVNIDDDLQHPPEVIPQLIEKLSEGWDVVYGTPVEEQHGFLRDAASRLTKLTLQHAMGQAVASKVSALRVFRTDIRSAFESFEGHLLSIDVLLTWGTSRFTGVPVPHEPRRSGNSNYTVGKLLVHALNMITGFSSWPLRLASWIGFGLTLFGAFVFAYLILRFALHRSTVPGFTFLASIITIFSGAQLFSLGIIGEYLSRVHFRSMERPTYVIRDDTARAERVAR